MTLEGHHHSINWIDFHDIIYKLYLEGPIRLDFQNFTQAFPIIVLLQCRKRDVCGFLTISVKYKCNGPQSSSGRNVFRVKRIH